MYTIHLPHSSEIDVAEHKVMLACSNTENLLFGKFLNLKPRCGGIIGCRTSFLPPSRSSLLSLPSRRVQHEGPC